jgi:hypothetical protein
VDVLQRNAKHLIERIGCGDDLACDEDHGNSKNTAVEA